MLPRIFAGLACAATAVSALTFQEWQKHSIYFAMVDRFARPGDDSTEVTCGMREYCGGTWKGIEEKLDYIQGMGFTAIWISPIIENVDAGTELGDPFHGYWPKNNNALNPNFGTEADLLSLSAALHDRNMALMLDVVPNHMASPGPFNATNFTALEPFNSREYYHNPCWLDNDNASSTTVCMTGDKEGRVTLADLKTENDTVRAIFGAWIKDTVDKYGVDGLRLDSAKHIEPSFWQGFLESAGDIWAMAEWLEGNPDAYPSLLEGVPGATNYAVFFWIQRAWQTRLASFDELVNGINKMKSLLGANTSALGVFTENHDQLRLASLTGDMANTKTAMTFAHLLDGIPVVYQGAEQHFSGSWDPANRQPLWSSGHRTDKELYMWYAKLNAIRKLAIDTDPSFLSFLTTPVSVIGAQTNAEGNSTTASPPVLAMKKGDVVSVYTNVGVGGAKVNLTLPATSSQYVADKEYVDVVSCEKVTASTAGALEFEVGELPRVWYPAEKVAGSGLCEAKDEPPKCEDTCIVKFNLTATTSFGQLMMMSGNVDAIGANDVAQSVLLDSATYPNWSLTVEVPSGSALEYQYLKMDGEGIITWDGGAKGAAVKTFNVPKDCSGRETVNVPADTFENDGAVSRRSRLVRKTGEVFEPRGWPEKR